MSVLMAFTVQHAARVTGVSERRIRYWDETGVLSPSLDRGRQRAPYNRIYAFRDLVGLRTLGKLRDDHHFTLQRLRLVGEWLSRYYDAPWSSLGFSVQGQDIFFRDPDTRLFVSTSRPGQASINFELVEIARQTETAANSLAERQPEDIGQIVRHRYVLGNRPLLAGTRIPTVAIWDFYKAGYDVDQIIREYPRLRPLDVERAIAFEQQRRQRLAS